LFHKNAIHVFVVVNLLMGLTALHCRTAQQNCTTIFLGPSVYLFIYCSLDFSNTLNGFRLSFEGFSGTWVWLKKQVISLNSDPHPDV